MSVGVELPHLMDYTDHERAKWRTWLAEDPSRLAVPFQSGGRFATIGSLVNHVFFIEERHLSRLTGKPIPEVSPVADDDLAGMFAYAARVRAEFRGFIASFGDAAPQPITFTLKNGPTMTVLKRKLAAHILLHEVRHFAQLAYAARVAGHQPPGEHDYFFSPADAWDITEETA
jgi:uncharacterized damage-inducible protein DinB